MASILEIESKNSTVSLATSFALISMLIEDLFALSALTRGE